jgi:uncharacterized membrane protein
MIVTHSPWRWAAAFLLLVTAGAHVPLIREHLQEAPYIGVLFALLAFVCVDLALAIVVIDTETVWIVGAAVCLAALLGFLASRTIGLPGIRDDVGNWTEPLGYVAMAAELTMVALTVAHVLHRRANAPEVPLPAAPLHRRQAS